MVATQTYLSTSCVIHSDCLGILSGYIYRGLKQWHCFNIRTAPGNVQQIHRHEMVTVSCCHDLIEIAKTKNKMHNQ